MKKQHFRSSVVALAVALSGVAAAPDAQALALGRVTVLSALGEPLVAEVDVPQISAEEQAELRTSLAGPDTFRAAGLTYNSALAGVQITLQRRPDGRFFLRLAGDRPVTEPFLDLILEAQWPSGRLVRDFTVLLDPPALRGQAAAPQPAPLPAQAAPAPRPAATPRPASAPVAAAPAPVPTANATAQRVTVRPGDTAAGIAAQHKPAQVSLDQMLVALLRANPDAFVQGNVNRLRSGAVLDLPGADQASAVSAAEARQTVVAQSRDFNEFRRRLAEGATREAAAPATAGRSAEGKLQAKVDEPRAAAAGPDRLTLSRGAVQAGQGASAAAAAATANGNAERIANQKAAQDANARLAQLNRNLSELNRLATEGAAGGASAAKPGVPVGAASSASMAAAATPVASAAALAASVPALPASQAASAAVPAASSAASAARPAASRAVAKAPAQAPVEPSLLDTLLAEPLLPAGAGALVLALAGLGFVRWRRNRQEIASDSSFLESKLQPDSFFGGSGGQKVDTAQATPAGNSMLYSASQLDTGDVDPVAEADVYLAYGRDMQAEEILREALRHAPQRVAIHVKLLEIYAKRRDVRAFEGLLGEVHTLTEGQGEDWLRACELGESIDPGNPAYAQASGTAVPADETPAEGGSPALPAGTPRRPPPGHGDFSASLPPDVLPSMSPEDSRLDALDLDLDLTDDGADTSPAPTSATALHPPDFDLSLPAYTAPDLTPPTQEMTLMATDTRPAPISAPAPAAPEAPVSTFDLEGLSLDLDLGGSAPAADSGDDAALATKLALATEFHALGDRDGARSLAEEVVAGANGDLKAQAQRLLSELG